MSGELGKAVVVMALVAGGLYAYQRWYAIDLVPSQSIERAPQETAELAPTTSAPAPADPPSSELLAEEDPVATPVIATVYECQGSEGRILSDKPCANNAHTLQVRAPNGMDPAKVETSGKPQEGGSSSLSIGVVIPPLETCAQLDVNEALANKRLRQKNSKENEERLRQLLRGYAVTRQEWKCGRAR
jgi:hypothetical protein